MLMTSFDFKKVSMNIYSYKVIVALSFTINHVDEGKQSGPRNQKKN